MLIDTHAHVNFNAFKDDGDEVIRRSLDNGVQVINVGSQYSTSRRAVDMAYKYVNLETKSPIGDLVSMGGVYAAVGLHPIQLQKRTLEYADDNELTPEEIKTAGEEFEYAKYLELAKDEKVVAIGEVGLDYHHFEEGDNVLELKVKQKEIFLQFIKLANEVEKPLAIHCWDAYPELLEILQNNPVKKRGVIHSFVGGYKTANQFIELGYKIGLNGIITYSESYDRLIKEIPIESILLETDCPYLGPVPKKGERNEPINVRYVAEKVAQIKEISLEEVAEITTKNAKIVFPNVQR